MSGITPPAPARRSAFAGADPLDFSPALLAVENRPPSPLPRFVLKTTLVFAALVLLWIFFGRLDVVAVADGKLIPQSYLKIVQPSDQGIVREILVKEGEPVREGQVLIRMDARLSEADGRSLTADYHQRRLALRRIDAQLADLPLARQAGDPAAFFAEAQAHYAANRRALEAAVQQERSVLAKARHELSAAREVISKLTQTVPVYREQEAAYEKLNRDGFAGNLLYQDKRRERIEKEQDLKQQEFVVQGAQSTIEQSERRIEQLHTDYARQLRTERAEVLLQYERGSQELEKQRHRNTLLELRAPQSGIVKDPGDAHRGHRHHAGHDTDDAGAEQRDTGGRSVGGQRRRGLRPRGSAGEAEVLGIHLPEVRDDRRQGVEDRRGRHRTRLKRRVPHSRPRATPGREPRLQGAHHPRCADIENRSTRLPPRLRHASRRRNQAGGSQYRRVPAVASAKGVSGGGAGAVGTDRYDVLHCPVCATDAVCPLLPPGEG